MKVHFIAIGGSAMHNLALALHQKGYTVTGSDDEIAEPSRSRLSRAGLLPVETGWFPDKITAELDAVILGMHAREDNPELQEARKKKIKIYSYPEYLYEQTRDKRRVVIGGSHGKTTITAIILYVLQELNMDCDFMVGAQLEGFDTMVKLTKSAKTAVIEGDEYLSSPIDRRPKFHLYRPDIALISGIAWDHINVFPTFAHYLEQFVVFAGLITEGGILVYNESDPEVRSVALQVRKDIRRVPYHVPEFTIENGISSVIYDGKKYPLKIFGEHNLLNLEGARCVCETLGINGHDFYRSAAGFRGAARRLELVEATTSSAFYKDFAHAPSKLRATTRALKVQFPHRRLIACMELHTFSSLNENFLAEYHDCMQFADEAIVYFNPHTIAHKKLKPVTEEQVKAAFGGGNLRIFTDIQALLTYLRSREWQECNLLMMSSGTFDGTDFRKLAGEIYTGQH